MARNEGKGFITVFVIEVQWRLRSCTISSQWWNRRREKVKVGVSVKASRRVERTAKSSNTFCLNFSAGERQTSKPPLSSQRQKITANNRSVTYTGNTFCPLLGIWCILLSGTANYKNKVWISADITQMYKNWYYSTWQYRHIDTK